MKRALLAVALGAIGACVDHGAGPGKKIDPSVIAGNLLAAVPAGVQRLDVDLEGKVIYVGNTVDDKPLAPGQTVQITHYWQVVKPIPKTWRVFAFVRGSANTA
ncbi:MAG: hypothetical protein H0T79_17070, partial [Deltaproteobacteria bacterium]|nr:hypothetical protein [Deltaproteobacteria bacterium]